ncbi:hypothetical protein FEO87_15785 [Stenotrophomonas maltophilia]|nr:hypothetical protein FEO87_15785 [Stenotrophomonas maltophilia]
MALTPLRIPPLRPLTDRCGVHPRKRKRRAKAKKRPGGRFFHARRTHERSDPLLLLIFFSSPWAGRARNLSGVGRVGFAGVSAAWMPRPSLQGRTCGVPREPNPPDQPHDSSTRPTHEWLRRWPEITPVRETPTPGSPAPPGS